MTLRAPARFRRAIRNLPLDDRKSVALREPRFGRRGAVAANARARRGRAVERHVADGRLGVGLDLGLTVGLAAPRRDHEPRPSFHGVLELLVGADALGMLLAELERPLVEAALHVLQELGQ